MGSSTEVIPAGLVQILLWGVELGGEALERRLLRLRFAASILHLSLKDREDAFLFKLGCSVVWSSTHSFTLSSLLTAAFCNGLILESGNEDILKISDSRDTDFVDFVALCGFKNPEDFSPIPRIGEAGDPSNTAFEMLLFDTPGESETLRFLCVEGLEAATLFPLDFGKP
jgi:hypothetical protein